MRLLLLLLAAGAGVRASGALPPCPCELTVGVNTLGGMCPGSCPNLTFTVDTDAESPAEPEVPAEDAGGLLGDTLPPNYTSVTFYNTSIDLAAGNINASVGDGGNLSLTIYDAALQFRADYVDGGGGGGTVSLGVGGGVLIAVTARVLNGNTSGAVVSIEGCDMSLGSGWAPNVTGPLDGAIGPREVNRDLARTCDCIDGAACSRRAALFLPFSIMLQQIDQYLRWKQLPQGGCCATCAPCTSQPTPAPPPARTPQPPIPDTPAPPRTHEPTPAYTPWPPATPIPLPGSPSSSPSSARIWAPIVAVFVVAVVVAAVFLIRRRRLNSSYEQLERNAPLQRPPGVSVETWYAMGTQQQLQLQQQYQLQQQQEEGVPPQ